MVEQLMKGRIMTADEKRIKVMETVSNVIEELLGHKKSDVTEDANLTERYGMDDIYAIRFMMKCEVAFNQQIDDKGFIPNEDIPQSEMWRNKTLRKLVDFLVKTLEFDKL